MVRLLIDDALETIYITGGMSERGASTEVESKTHLMATDVQPGDFALIQTPEVGLLAETHMVDPVFGVFTAESGAIAMRTPVRPDEVEEASVLLYDIGATAEVLARATIWPFYGIRSSAWTTEPDGSSAVTIVDGLAALEPAEAGFSEDLVRAWYILTEQPVVTHLLAVPVDAADEAVEAIRTRLIEGAKAGYAERRELRKALLGGTLVESERLVDFLARVRYELDEAARAAAYSLIARGAGGTRFPLIRALSWRGSD